MHALKLGPRETPHRTSRARFGAARAAPTSTTPMLDAANVFGAAETVEAPTPVPAPYPRPHHPPRPALPTSEWFRGKNVGELTNVAVVAVTASFLFLALLWPALAGPAPTPPVRLDGLQAQWGVPGPDGLPLLVQVRLNNPNTGGATLERIEVRAQFNDADMGTALLEGPRRLFPGDQTLHLRLPLSPDVAGTWWQGGALRAEHFHFSLTGEAITTVDGTTHNLPLRLDRSWSTRLQPSLDQSVRSCQPGARDICVETSDHEWTTAADGNALLRSRLTLLNPTPQDVTVRAHRAGLRLEGIDAATGPPQADVVAVPAGNRADLVFTLRPELGPLGTWWAAHVARCEESAAAFWVELEVAEAGPPATSESAGGNATVEAPPVRIHDRIGWVFPLTPLQTHIVCAA